MIEIANKINYIALRSKISRLLSSGIEDDYQKRILARGVFLSVDAFLIFAPRLKNQLFKSGGIDLSLRCELGNQIESLKKDYDKVYDIIRDAFTAHRLSFDLSKIFEYWNDIDQATVEVLDDQIFSISQKLLGILNIASLSDEINDEMPKLIAELNQNFSVDNTPNISTDSLALTRTNTGSLIPCHPNQEKASRIVSIIDIFGYLIAYTRITKNYIFPHELIWALLILDAFSFIENVYKDRPEDRSLLTIWTEGDYEGAKLINQASNNRNIALEDSLRNVRNHFAAHIDDYLSLKNIRTELINSEHVKFATYIHEHMNIFFKACSLDIRTKMFLILREKVDVYAITGGITKKYDYD